MPRHNQTPVPAVVDPTEDPLVKRAIADGVVERALVELTKLLRELAAQLDPFPSFLGLSSIQALEVNPSGVSNPERGCIVVCPDGELYELTLRMLPGPIDVGGVEQTEEIKEIELSPGDRVAYCHAAIGELTRIIEERRRE